MRFADRLAEGEQAENPPPRPGPPGSGEADFAGANLPAPLRVLGRSRGKPQRSRFSGGLKKVAALLKEVDRNDLEALMSDPKLTTEQVREWLAGRGYQFGVKAVRTHVRDFKASLEEVRRSARFADAFYRLFGKAGRGTIFSEILVTRFEQALMQQMFKLDDQGMAVELPVNELKELGKLLEQAVDSRKQCEALRRDFEETRRQIAKEARDAAGKGQSGPQIADNVRLLLGVPLGDEGEE